MRLPLGHNTLGVRFVARPTRSRFCSWDETTRGRARKVPAPLSGFAKARLVPGDRSGRKRLQRSVRLDLDRYQLLERGVVRLANRNRDARQEDRRGEVANLLGSVHDPLAGHVAIL